MEMGVFKGEGKQGRRGYSREKGVFKVEGGIQWRRVVFKREGDIQGRRRYSMEKGVRRREISVN